ncbi:uncharacterized protein [Pseudorasbora parva]|uniref:uncharacterized protein n=1 Tax=Pseudorasbora parva TaxID=51549 RepID=UPI00351DF8EB
MPWTNGILYFTMAVIMLSSSSRAGLEAFSEMGDAYGAVSESPVRFGKLLIGAQGAVSDLRSAEQSDEYRSNEERFYFAKAKLHRMGSSVHCGNDSMTLHIPGLRMPRFLVDRGDQSPVPLSEVPASCGFSLKRARRSVSLVAPYQGCHVGRQGGSYVLPLVVMGAPVQMSCPMSPRLPTVSCYPSGMIISLDGRADDVKIKVAGSWQPLLLVRSICSLSLEYVGGSLVVTAPFTGSCWVTEGASMRLPLLYGDLEVILSCPVTQPTLTPITTSPTTIAPTVSVTQNPTNGQQMFYPFPFGRPWWFNPYYHVPPTVPPTTTTTQAPGQQMIQQMHYPMFHPHYFGSKGFPGAPQPHLPRYPMFPPYMYHVKNPFVTTTPATTSTVTTSATTATTTTSETTLAATTYEPPFNPFNPPPFNPASQRFYGPRPLHHGYNYPFMSQY